MYQVAVKWCGLLLVGLLAPPLAVDAEVARYLVIMRNQTGHWHSPTSPSCPLRSSRHKTS